MIIILLQTMASSSAFAAEGCGQAWGFGARPVLTVPYRLASPALPFGR